MGLLSETVSTGVNVKGNTFQLLWPGNTLPFFFPHTLPSLNLAGFCSVPEASMAEAWQDCPALGPGWKRRVAFRKSGASCGRSDIYYQR